MTNRTIPLLQFSITIWHVYIMFIYRCMLFYYLIDTKKELEKIIEVLTNSIFFFSVLLTKWTSHTVTGRLKPLTYQNENFKGKKKISSF